MHWFQRVSFHHSLQPKQKKNKKWFKNHNDWPVYLPQNSLQIKSNENTQKQSKPKDNLILAQIEYSQPKKKQARAGKKHKKTNNKQTNEKNKRY